jgi:glycine hydroxymethyltransferase
MPEIARWIDEVLRDEGAIDRVRGEVTELARAFPPPA